MVFQALKLFIGALKAAIETFEKAQILAL